MIDGSVSIQIDDGVWIRDRVIAGRDVTLGDWKTMPEYSGYDFSELLKRSYDHPFTDMFVESDSWGDLFMAVRDDTEITDLGYTMIAADAIYVPRAGWSADRSVGLIVGHEYVIRTWDGHYAKFVVTNLMSDRVMFDWAYQSDEPMAGVFPAVQVRQERFTRFGR